METFRLNVKTLCIKKLPGLSKIGKFIYLCTSVD